MHNLDDTLGVFRGNHSVFVGVVKLHQGTDNLVHLPFVHVCGDGCFQGVNLWSNRHVSCGVHPSVHTGNKAANALDVAVGPIAPFGVRTHKHQIHTQLIGVKIVGVDHVALGFGHLRAVFGDHALVNHLFERLFDRHNSCVKQHHMDEARVNQMHAGVLASTNIGVHLLVFVFGNKFVLIVRAITDVIKRGIHKGVQGVGFPLHRNGAAPRTLAGDAPIGQFLQPHPLLFDGGSGVINMIQVFDQTVFVVGDFKKPLIQILLFHGGGAALAVAAGRLFVGQHGLARRTPIDVAPGFVRQAAFVQNIEHVLSPLGVLRIAGDQALFKMGVHARHLTTEALDVVPGDVFGVGANGAGVVFGGQTERVVAKGLEDLNALVAFPTANGIGNHIVVTMPHMQALA